MAEYLKDPKLEQQYRDVFATTDTPGWEIIVTEIKDLAGPLENIRTVRDLDDLRFRQGMLNILDRLTSYREVVRADYDALLEEEAKGEPDESF